MQQQPNRPKRPVGATAGKRMLVQSVQQQQAVLAEFGIEAVREVLEPDGVKEVRESEALDAECKIAVFGKCGHTAVYAQYQPN